VNAAIDLRMLEIRARRERDVAAAALERLGARPRPRPAARPWARRIGWVLIRIGEQLAGPAPGPARAR